MHSKALTTLVSKHLRESADVKLRTAERCDTDIIRAATVIADSLRRGQKLLLCGNGGSAADCQHLAAEFVSRLSKERERRALPAIALTTDTSVLTAYANDFGFDGVYARQVEALGNIGDVLLCITTSGRSRNVLNATAQAKCQGMRVIILTSEQAPPSDESTLIIRVPSSSTQHIQEAHIAIEHLLCALVEVQLFPSESFVLPIGRDRSDS